MEPDRIGDLLNKVADGDHEALAELYAETSRDVLTTITALLVDRHHAEEVRQEVYLQLWLSAAAVFDSDRGLGRPFVMAVARRRAIDRIRTVRSSRRRDTEWDGLEDPIPDFSEVMVNRAQLQAALSALGDRAHTIIAVYYFGQSHKEIARRLGVTVTTVKSRHRRALVALRALIS